MKPETIQKGTEILEQINYYKDKLQDLSRIDSIQFRTSGGTTIISVNSRKFPEVYALFIELIENHLKSRLTIEKNNLELLTDESIPNIQTKHPE